MAKAIGDQPPEKPVRSTSRIDSDYLRRRTEMFQNFRMAGYHKIGTGDPANVPQPKGKAKAKAAKKGAKK